MLISKNFWSYIYIILDNSIHIQIRNYTILLLSFTQFFSTSEERNTKFALSAEEAVKDIRSNSKLLVGGEYFIVLHL